MIIDSHAHIWPSIAKEEEWEVESIDELMKHIQRLFFAFHLPAWRVKDNSLKDKAWKTLWNESLLGTWEARYNVNFRIEKGRFLWDKDGTEYYYPAPPPAPPEKIISLMDKVGVDKAVLQHSFLTFKLNKYYSRALNKYQERLIGLVQIDPTEAYTHQQKVNKELRMYIEDLGFKGLFWETAPAGWDEFDNFHTDKYDFFWREVQSLNIPVFIAFSEWDYPVLKVKKWVERFPNIVRVLVHGFPPKFLLKDENTFQVSDTIIDIVNNHNVYLEIIPRAHLNYTGPKGDAIIRCLYNTFGPSKLVWGSELGYTSTASKYSKVLGYFEEKCDYISKEDLKLILGENVRKIFRI